MIDAEWCSVAISPKALPMYSNMHPSNNVTEALHCLGLAYHVFHTSWARQQLAGDRTSYNTDWERETREKPMGKRRSLKSQPSCSITRVWTPTADLGFEVTNYIIHGLNIRQPPLVEPTVDLGFAFGFLFFFFVFSSPLFSFIFSANKQPFDFFFFFFSRPTNKPLVSTKNQALFD